MQARRPATLAILAVLLFGAGCERGRSDESKPQRADEDDASSGAEPEAPREKPPSYAMTFLEDDYPGALAAAREADKPIVVMMWARWCHSCLSMHHEVLPDPGLEVVADRFVWLKIDTDKEVNAPVLERLSIEVWPTFYVIGPDETIHARLTSAASVEQFRDFLLEGERAYGDAQLQAGELESAEPLYHARVGDRALAKNEYQAAREAYERALELAESSWVRRPDVLLSYMHATMRAGDAEDCAEVARAHIEDTGLSSSAVRFGLYTRWCGEGQVDHDARLELLELADGRLRGLLEGEHQLTADDQSNALRTRRSIQLALGHDDAARELANRQRDLLDRAAEQAIGPYAASSYSGPRAEVYAFLGETDVLLPKLIDLAEALPGEYDPPYRVAWLAYQARDLETASTWAERSLALSYGPRKGSVLELLAEIHEEAGDEEAEREILQRLVAHLDSLPEHQKHPRQKAEARARLREL